MSKKKILAVTGTRADYGIFVPVFQAINASPDLSLELVVTGMHLLPAFGKTVDEIEKDGFTIAAKVDTMKADDTLHSMAEFVGRTTTEFATLFAKHSPDIVLLLGDRGEMLAGATAAVYEHIPIAHLHGGEQSGSVDDPVRHAITQLATFHFVSTALHGKNVEHMRGSKENIHVVGAPALDAIRAHIPIAKEQLMLETGFDASLPTVIFLQHADTIDALPTVDQIGRSIAALESLQTNILLCGSNADAGGVLFNERLQAFAKSHPHTYFKTSMPHTNYLSWLSFADVLVGNSSSGIIEAASFHVPAVNIGDRQKGRTRSGNVLDVPYETDAINEAINKALTNAPFKARVKKCKNVYGDGHAAARIVSILTECTLPLH